MPIPLPIPHLKSVNEDESKSISLSNLANENKSGYAIDESLLTLQSPWARGLLNTSNESEESYHPDTDSNVDIIAKNLVDNSSSKELYKSKH